MFPGVMGFKLVFDAKQAQFSDYIAHFTVSLLLGETVGFASVHG